MLFFAFTFIAALVSIIVPVALLKIFVRKWHLPAKIFWKSGLAGIVTALVVFGVTLNIDGTFPNFVQLPALAQALILGLLTGLFAELGKFLVLDRMMPTVRTRESTLLFGLGWGGVAILLMGFVLALGVFGMQNLLNTKDLASTLPNADPDQLKFLQESQQQLQTLVSGTPLKAFTPLLENVTIVLLDMAMSLLIVLGLNKKQSRQVWLAVGVRTLYAASLFFVAQTGSVPVEAVFGAWTIAAGGILFLLQKKFRPAA